MKKKFKLFFVFLLILSIPFLGQAFDKWPDTGQTTTYTDTFGEDNDYSFNPQSYTKLASGGTPLDASATPAQGWIMTKDNVTGLIWEVKQNKDSTPDSENPHDADNTYTWCDTNSETNGGNAGTCGVDTDTTDFIAALNTADFGGYSDWRLPTIKELSTVVNNDRISSPIINITFFANTIPSEYWSSNTNINSSSNAWYVDFSDSEVFYYYKSYSYCVRAVRTGQ